jgi:hypothetical protein
LTGGKQFHLITHLRNTPDNLVADDQWKLGIGQFAVDHMQIGATDGARENLKLDFAAAWFGSRAIAERERPTHLF